MREVASSAGPGRTPAANPVIGGTFGSGNLGFAGFFMGAVFLIIGMLVGRDKQVVYMQAPQGAPPQG